MFYSEAILSRRGPLAKVWLAAHMERKLSKAQTLQTDIEQSVDAIMDQEVEVMALRLSGQLLLGVVRIYSRKAKYLLDDCNEALLKIKMAFKPGVVDMTEDQLTVNRNAITLRAGTADLDVLLPDINWDFGFDDDRIIQPQGQHVARAADITLATGADDMQFDFDEAGYGDLGPTDGIGSQDYDVDLGLDFGDGPLSEHDTASIEGRGRDADVDDNSSVEVGRDAHAPRAPRESIDSHLLGPGGEADLDLISHRSRQVSEDPFGADMAMDIDFGPDLGVDVDLGLTFDDQPLSEGQKTPGQTRSLSRASSPLSEAPRTPPPPGVESTAEIAAGEGTPPQQPESQTEEPTKSKRKEKKQIFDDQTELQTGRRGRNGFDAAFDNDVSAITAQNRYLPRSSLVMQLLDIRQDPVAHFLPTKTTANGTFFYAGPPDLAPELQEMFMRPVPARIPGAKRRGASPEKPSSKRARIEDEAGPVSVDPVEQHRRAISAAPSAALGSEMLGRGGSVGPSADVGGFEFDTVPGMDDFQMELPPDVEMPQIGGDMDPEVERAKSVARSELSRMSTPALGEEGDETYADLECPIAAFDMKGQSQASETTSSSSEDGKGYSKNTVKALGIIRRELQPDEEGDEETEKSMSFRKMTHKATRRAASSFFFELLVLGTRDCVKLHQRAPYENIHIRAKDKLWDRQRHASMAPSELGSALGL